MGQSTTPTNIQTGPSFLQRLNHIQLRHKSLGFLLAVQRKYSDDHGGYQAALVTYYGFLSLLPLLVIVISIAQLTVFRGSGLKSRIPQILNRYFPLLGTQLARNVHAERGASIALIVSLAITFYGATSIASVFQYVINHVWEIPRRDRKGGLQAIRRNFTIIIFGGLGYLLADVISTAAAGLGRSLLYRIIAIAISLIVSFGVILLLFVLSLAEKRTIRELLLGAVTAAIGFQIVQTIGGFIIARQLSHLSTIYGAFAFVLGILFWIYLQARIVVYALEINTVHRLQLWPRSLVSKELTPADKHALQLYAKRERREQPPTEEISVQFQP